MRRTAAACLISCAIESGMLGEAAQVRRNTLNIVLASGFGLGLSPIAPGTCAALLGVALHLAIALVASPHWVVPAIAVVFIVVCIANHLLTPWAQEYWSHKDPKHFVLDEIAGYLVVPLLFRHGQLWQVALWGFLIFRVLDIIKLPPARQIDRNGTGAWAILLDDIISAVYTVGVLQALRFIGPSLGITRWLIG